MATSTSRDSSRFAARIWAHDATFWTGADEAQWLGWLDIVDLQLSRAAEFTAFASEVKARGFVNALLLGMGGSSLCPEVMKLTFGKHDGFPELFVLDSTDPAEILAIQAKIDVPRTLFIVSSKSGSTLEPNIFKEYFFDLAKDPLGFIAITDPGSKMEQVARNDGFWKIFCGVKSIGGRYSALSDFGMIPAAAMGVDVPRFLASAKKMVELCKVADPALNPGVALGLQLGKEALSSRDKVTIVASPAIADLGAWLEQLLAESTGKIGKGLIPVDREVLGAPEVYGRDRVFAYERYLPGVHGEQDTALAAIERAGHPLVCLEVHDTYDLGQEFFRWEIATAVAGAMIGINPFDQPDVEASKVVTRDLTDKYEETGSLPAEAPIFEGGGIKLFTDPRNAADLGQADSLKGYVAKHLSRISPGDYFALLGYIEMNAENEAALQKIRLLVRDKLHVATCLGFGPRFLHSTGQAYKGGPNSGVFLQITCDDAVELPVPGRKYTFGVVKAAQARGDFAVLAERKRRALRVHLPVDLKHGLEELYLAVAAAL
jgi:transaldolase/glucose-6-phosphate isomerase